MTITIIIIASIILFWGLFAKILNKVFKIISRVVLIIIIVACIYKYNGLSIYEELPNDLSKENLKDAVDEFEDTYTDVKEFTKDVKKDVDYIIE